MIMNHFKITILIESVSELMSFCVFEYFAKNARVLCPQRYSDNQTPIFFFFFYDTEISTTNIINRGVIKR